MGIRISNGSIERDSYLDFRGNDRSLSSDVNASSGIALSVDVYLEAALNGRAVECFINKSESFVEFHWLERLGFVDFDSVEVLDRYGSSPLSLRCRPEDKRPPTIDNLIDDFLGSLDDSLDKFLSAFEKLLEEATASDFIRPFGELDLVFRAGNIGSCQSKVDISDSVVAVSA